MKTSISIKSLIVIGGGLSGLSTAYFLKKKGVFVTSHRNYSSLNEHRSIAEVKGYSDTVQ